MSYCKAYREHKEKYGDYNLMGQALWLLCRIEETDFTNEGNIQNLKIVAKRVSDNIREIIKGRLQEQK